MTGEAHVWHFMVKGSCSDWLHHSTSQDTENFNRKPRWPITLNLYPCDPTSKRLYNLPKEHHQQRTKHSSLWVCERDSSHLSHETNAKWEHSVGLLGSREIESNPALKTIWLLFEFFKFFALTVYFIICYLFSIHTRSWGRRENWVDNLQKKLKDALFPIQLSFGAEVRQHNRQVRNDIVEVRWQTNDT